MSDSLRDRIGKAICDATSSGKLFPWDTLNEREQETWRGYADAVIAELGLRHQGLRNGFFIVPEPPWDKHRYVTDWKADDE